MSSDIEIKIKCPDYLIKFLISLYGEMPIVFPKNHDLIRTLNHLLNRPPKDYHEDSIYEDTLRIQLPHFEDKDVYYNFYLSEYSKRLFLIRLTRYFKLIFRDDINQSRLCGFNEKDSINLFIDKFNLNSGGDIYSNLEKDYRRYFNIKHVYRYQNKRKKKSSVKASVL
jgi:hypothetical protein